jgi:glutamate--cysteine ligase
VDETEIRFIEAMMLFCLLAESPRIGLQERWEIDRNLEKVAHRGRDPQLRLMRNGKGQRLQDWGGEVLDQFWPLCELLDGDRADGPHSQALQAQIDKVADPDATPSALMLAEMRDRGEGFYEFANRLSRAHARYFRQRELPQERRDFLDNEVRLSIDRSNAIEAQSQIDFDEFLNAYQKQ